jgi:pimeloyl-ACP methyl ester carboxylesterase
MTDHPQLIPRRANGAAAAIVLVHGFGGHAAATWGRFPELLEEQEALKHWDLYSIGYSTSLAFDIAGVWSADPEIITLGGLLQAVTDVSPFDRYQSIALVAHSMGGLLVQRAILSDSKLRSRVSHVLLFGTPSAGLEKASPFQFWKRQVRDMGRSSEFITTLRQEWATTIGPSAPFRFMAIAGDRDEFVPRVSSLDPFPEACRRVVYGNHLEIVKPPDPTHLGFKVALKELTGGGTGGGVRDSALLAVESRRFQQAIDTLWPHRAELDDEGLATLALALESVGRQQEAIEMLRSANPRGTDPVGVLAGRLKRRWLAERRRADAEQALALYGQALSRAEAKPDPEQAHYLAINCAFMELAYGGDTAACRAYAERALRHCAAARDDVWRRATEGEANLYLGNTALAADAYRRAIAAKPEPWQAASIYQQAYRAADLMGEEGLGAELRRMFGDVEQPPQAAT